MTQLTQKNNQDLFKILVAVAWIDGEVQPQEKEMLKKIATEQNLASNAELEKLLAANQTSSTEHCYALLKEYLGSNPSAEDYHSLLSAVSTLIYSDDDIATEEASLLTQMQNLDPNNSAFDKAISKIQKIYQAAMKRV